MENASLWLSFVLAIASVSGAVFAFVQARSATASRVDAQSARDEAARLAAEANAAFVRQADAQERANELAEAAVPVKEVHWALMQVSKSRWLVTNDGTLGAVGALLRSAADGDDGIRPDESEPRDVIVGDSLGFLLWRAFGMSAPRLQVVWTNPMTEKSHEIEIAVPV